MSDRIYQNTCHIEWQNIRQIVCWWVEESNLDLSTVIVGYSVFKSSFHPLLSVATKFGSVPHQNGVFTGEITMLNPFGANLLFFSIYAILVPMSHLSLGKSQPQERDLGASFLLVISPVLLLVKGTLFPSSSPITFHISCCWVTSLL